VGAIMAHIGTFDVNKFIVVFGAFSIEGYAKDSMIDVAFKENRINSDQGVDGEVTRVITGKKLATITIKLMQSSLSNDMLSSIFNADTLGNIPLPLIIKDLKGTTVFSAVAAWIEKYSDCTFGSDAQIREWSIAAPLDAWIGGNQL
jgi:hypothetical protein